MDLDELRAFLAVAKTGSFLAAAQELRQPRATLRRRVNALEARAGVTLFERSNSGVSLTQPGALLADNGRELLQQAGALLSSLREVDSEPSGELRVVLPEGAPVTGLTPLLQVMRMRYPKLRATIHFSDDPLRAQDDFHLAAHFGVRTPKGPWTAFPLARMRMGLLASADYLRRNGTPERVEDLAEHTLMSWLCPSEDPGRWPCANGHYCEVEPAMTSANSSLLRRCAHAGMGIAMVPDVGMPDVGNEDSEALVPVLPEQVGRAHDLRLVIHEALASSPRLSAIVRETQRFVDMMRAAETRVEKLGARLQDGRSRIQSAFEQSAV